MNALAKTIEGVASESARSARPRCRHCGDALAATCEHERVQHGYVKTNRIRGYGYLARGHFCSLRCGWRFGVEVIEAYDRRKAEGA